jgi:hypothetical protein
MSILRRAFILSVTVFLPCLSWSQQDQQQPVQLSPEVVKVLQQQEKWLMDSIAESNKHPGPTFDSAQCRADTQKWTTDTSDFQDPRNLGIATGVMVNGDHVDHTGIPY